MDEQPTPQKKRTTTKKTPKLSDIKDAAQSIASKEVSEVKKIITEKAAQLGAEAKSYSEKGCQKVASSVKKQPLKALGIAALFGAIFGLFVRKKKK